MASSSEYQPTPDIDGKSYRSDKEHAEQVSKEPPVDDEPESILDKRLDGSRVEPENEESVNEAPANDRVGGDGAPLDKSAEQLVADEKILNYEIQEKPRAALEDCIKNIKETWIQTAKKKQQKIKAKLQKQMNLKGVTLENYETIFDAWYQKQQSLYEHKNDAVYQKIYEDFLRVQKIFQLLKDNPNTSADEIDNLSVQKESVEVKNSSISAKAGGLSSETSEGQGATIDTETDNSHKDMPPTENSSESPADSNPDASGNPEEESMRNEKKTTTSEVGSKTEYPEGAASLTGLAEVFDIREFPDIAASNSLDELVELWENRDEKRKNSDDEYYKWRDALKFKMEKVARNNITAPKVNKETLSAIHKKIPPFFEVTEDAMKVLAALNEKKASKEKVKKQREKLIQEYEDINQALKQAQSWKKQGKTIHAVEEGELPEDSSQKVFHIRGVDIPAREVELISPLSDSGGTRIDITEFVDSYEPLSEQPFSQFDLREVVAEGHGSDAVKDRVSKKGMYLSADNDCFVKLGGVWNKFKGYKKYRDFLRNEAEPDQTNLSWKDVTKIVEEDFNEEEEYQKTVSQAIQEAKNMRETAKQKMVRGEEGKIWHMGWVDEEGAPEIGLYDAQTDKKTTVPLIDQNGRTFRQRFTVITENQETVDSNQSERAGENQEQTKGPISPSEILSLLKNKLPEDPSEEEREAVYKEIWEKAKERGEIQTLDGGSYRREQETLGGVTKPKWFRISPNGSRGQYGHLEARASLEGDNDVEMAYRKFFTDVMKEYQDELRRQRRNKARGSRPTDTASEVPKSVKKDSVEGRSSLEKDTYMINAYRRRVGEEIESFLNQIEAELRRPENDGKDSQRQALLEAFENNPKGVIRSILDHDDTERSKDMQEVLDSVKNSTGESNLKRVLEALQKVERKEVNPGDMVEFTEGGRKYKVDKVGDIEGNTILILEDGQVKKREDVTKVSSQGTQEDNQAHQAEEEKDEKEASSEATGGFADLDTAKAIIRSAESPNAAAEKLLSYDKIATSEDQYLYRKEDGWASFSKAEGKDIEPFSDEEMEKQIIDWITGSEAWNEERESEFSGQTIDGFESAELMPSTPEVTARLENFLGVGQSVFAHILKEINESSDELEGIKKLKEDGFSEDEARDILTGWQAKFRSYNNNLSNKQHISQEDLKGMRGDLVETYNVFCADTDFLDGAAGLSDHDFAKALAEIDRVLKKADKTTIG